MFLIPVDFYKSIAVISRPPPLTLEGLFLDLITLFLKSSQIREIKNFLQSQLIEREDS